MKKIGLLLLLCLSTAAIAQQVGQAPTTSADRAAVDEAANQDAPEGTFPNAASFPIERVQMPTKADLYCAGFLSKERQTDSAFVSGGLQTPTTAKFADGDMIYLAGKGYEAGQQYKIIRELRDINEFEMFAGQHSLLKAAGHPYGEIALVRIVDTRHKLAIARISFSCDAVNPGDLVAPYVEKQPIAFHPPLRFDRFIPPTGKLSGRILLTKDFDAQVGSGAKVYINVGSNQGVKVGDYFRAVRFYTADLHDPVDSLSFKAAIAEDTQARQPSIDPKFGTKNNGVTIHVADLPRRSVGEMVIIGTTPTTATGMIVFAMEEVHLGDGVEMDEQQ
ncbi:MAG: hypothetical protein JWO91_1478 [Acidobacteriaceae bacterium]|nr:hypothetical protein [Acidobacteriaceae bacterium]